MENTIRYATFGQRLRAVAVKGWQRGSGWEAALGRLVGRGLSQAAAVDDLAEQVRKVAERAYDSGYLVVHEDGSLTACVWFGDGVSQVRVRDGRTVGSASSDWASPEKAAEAAVRPESYGPGAVVRL